MPVVLRVQGFIPSLLEVRAFAEHLHALGAYWQGEIFGWEAEYSPELPQKPLDSNLQFTPATFCIGESGIWFYSLMWENGKTNPPNEFLDDRSLVHE